MIVQLNQDTIQKLKIFVDEGLELWLDKDTPLDHFMFSKSDKSVLITGYYPYDESPNGELKECKKKIYLCSNCDYKTCEVLRGKFPVITYGEWMLIR